MNTAFLDPLRHVKAHITRALRGAAPTNFQARDPSLIEGDVAYAIGVARSYREHLAAAAVPLAGARLLEIGPGCNFAVPLILAADGAEVTVADRFLAPWNANYHPRFYALLRSRLGTRNEALEAVIAANGYPEKAIRQIPKSIEDLTEGRFDCVLSNAVLEHVMDMRIAARNLAAITLPGGANLHQIDFHDHRYSDRPLEFLLLDAEEQARVFRRWNGETGNRVRLSEAVSLFNGAGFGSCKVIGESYADEAYMRGFVPRLRASPSIYRDWPESDLRVTSACLVLRR